MCYLWDVGELECHIHHFCLARGVIPISTNAMVCDCSYSQSRSISILTVDIFQKLVLTDLLVDFCNVAMALKPPCLVAWTEQTGVT